MRSEFLQTIYIRKKFLTYTPLLSCRKVENKIDITESREGKLKKKTMDELEKLRKHWQDDDFQRKHALAREIVVNRLRELNREYEEKTGQGFVRFIETRMKTPESIAEKLQRKDYDVDFDTAVTALNDISGVRCICYSVKEIYWIARQIGKTDTYTVVKAKDYIRKPKKNGYESYHIVLDIPMSYKGKTTVVRVELQLRTMIMDAWAGMDNRVS